MKKVERNELLGLAEYEQIRPQFRARIIGEKKSAASSSPARSA